LAPLALALVLLVVLIRARRRRRVEARSAREARHDCATNHNVLLVPIIRNEQHATAAPTARVCFSH
jgi:hypothetical protein